MSKSETTPRPPRQRDGVIAARRADEARPESEHDGRELPEGWTWAAISELTESVPNIKPEDEPDREFDYVDISAICNSTFRITEAKKIRGKDAPSRARRPVKPNDTLFSNVRTYLRNIALVTDDTPADVCSTGFTVLRPNAAVDPRYLFRFVLSDDFIDRVTPQQTGTHYPATSDRVVMAERVPLPPLAEQRRIVGKLELLLGKVSSSQQRLSRVPGLLKRFRQSVLAAACSGKLTADWREENDVAMEDWNESKLLELLAEPLANGRSVRDATDGFPVLRLTCLKNGRIDLAERKIGEWTKKDAQRFLVKKDDYFVSRGNGSHSLVGRGGLVVDEPDDVAYPDTLIRVRLQQAILSPEFVSSIWNSSQIRSQIEAAAHTTAGIWKISQADIEGFVLPVPPLSEQQEIVRRVEKLFAFADQIEARLRQAKAHVDRLTQSLLAKAFRGELVPTEHALARREGRDYETASVLLARIQSQRATSSKNGSKPSRPRVRGNPPKRTAHR